MRVAAIVLAAGASARMAAPYNKAYLDLDGEPVVTRSLKTLGGDDSVVRLILVIRPEDRHLAEAAVASLRAGVELVEGGPTRQLSERAGLQALETAIDEGEIDLVAIHDAARPFFTRSLWDRLLHHAAETGGAVPAVAAGPLFTCEGDIVGPRVHPTPIRVQTPQVFRAVPLLGAYRVAESAATEADDTAQVIERFSSIVVAAVAGEEKNMKITFPADLESDRT